MMEEESYDGTEQTPQPTLYRPPPMQMTTTTTTTIKSRTTPTITPTIDTFHSPSTSNIRQRRRLHRGHDDRLSHPMSQSVQHPPPPPRSLSLPMTVRNSRTTTTPSSSTPRLSLEEEIPTTSSSKLSLPSSLRERRRRQHHQHQNHPPRPLVEDSLDMETTFSWSQDPFNTNPTSLPTANTIQQRQQTKPHRRRRQEQPPPVPLSEVQWEEEKEVYGVDNGNDEEAEEGDEDENSEEDSTWWEDNDDDEEEDGITTQQNKESDDHTNDPLIQRTQRSLRVITMARNRGGGSIGSNSSTTTFGSATTGNLSLSPLFHGPVPLSRHHHPTISQRIVEEEYDEDESRHNPSSTISSVYGFNNQDNHLGPQKLPLSSSPHNHHNSYLPSAKEVSMIHETALQALIRLKEELIKSHFTNQRLRHEQEEKENQWQGKQSHWVEQLDRLEESLKIDLQSKQKELDDQSKAWNQERMGWEERLSHFTRERKESLHRKVSKDNRIKELKQPWESAKKELDEMTQRHSKLVDEHTSVLQSKTELESENASLQEQLTQLNEKINELNNQKDHLNEMSKEEEAKKEAATQLLQDKLTAKEQEVADLTMTLTQLKEAHGEQIEQWKKKAAQVNDKSLGRELEEDSVSSSAADATTPRRKSTNMTRGNTRPFHTNDNGGGILSSSSYPTPHPDLIMESSVSDRIARMKDSAERAHLIKGHKREMTRLTMEHDHYVQKLQDNHQEALRKVDEESRVTLQSQLDEMKRVLKLETEELLKKTRDDQRDKLAEVRTILMRTKNSSTVESDIFSSSNRGTCSNVCLCSIHATHVNADATRVSASTRDVRSSIT